MLSTIVLSSSAAEGPPLAAGPAMRTLAALVSATVEGVVRDVVLLTLPGGADLALLADEAGCRLVEGTNFAEAFARAIAGARSTSLFVVKAGAVPSPLFGGEVARALDGEPHRSLLLREEPTGALARVLPALSPVVGVILQRARLAGARCQGFSDVVRRARPSRPLPSPAAVRG